MRAQFARRFTKGNLASVDSFDHGVALVRVGDYLGIWITQVIHKSVAQVLSL
jgi:hypothetical protein